LRRKKKEKKEKEGRGCGTHSLPHLLPSQTIILRSYFGSEKGEERAPKSGPGLLPLALRSIPFQERRETSRVERSRGTFFPHLPVGREEKEEGRK